LSAAGQRERAALGARQQAVDPVLPRRLHRGATHTVARAVARGGRERGLQGGHAGLPREAPAEVPGPLSPVRFEFLSSTPPSPTEGSGTWVAIDGVLRGLGGVELRNSNRTDRKSTRLNSSHVATSYAVFC